jgi:uncharacterized protein
MKYKLSYYTIITDAVDSKGSSILFSSISGKALLVPKITLDYIAAGRIDEIPAEVTEKLIRISALVPHDRKELESLVSENIASTEVTTETLYEIIQPTATCQLGCYYCGQSHSKNNLKPEVIDHLIARIRGKIAAGQYKKLVIGWFGAEPLMGLQQMREITKRLMIITEEFGLAYSANIVTNGLSLKPNIFDELSRELNVRRFEITLDGTAETHNKNRITKSGEDSFELIFNNLKGIVTNPAFDPELSHITIRCNVDENNHEFVLPLIHMLAEHGIHKQIDHFYAIGIYSWGNDAHKKALTKETFAQKEIIWITEMLKLGYPMALLPKRKKSVCTAVSKVSEMYDANGNIFNCTEISYVDKYKDSEYILGKLGDSDPEPKKRPFSDWNTSLLTDQFPCHSCKLLPVCGGACPKSWHEDMRACPSMKFNIKDRLKLYYLISQSKTNTEFIQKLTLVQ